MSMLDNISGFVGSLLPTALGAGAGFVATGGNPLGALAGGALGSQAGQFWWQKQSYKKQMDREDNSVQRRLADLRAAGLSPTLAAGSGADSSAVFRSAAPDASEAAEKALAVMQMNAGISQTEAQTLLANQQAQKLDLEKTLVQAQTKQALAASAKTQIEAAVGAHDLRIYNKNPEILSHASAVGGNLRDVRSIADQAKSMYQKWLGDKPVLSPDSGKDRLIKMPLISQPSLQDDIKKFIKEQKK